ncbi:FecR family protein [Polaribacter sp.]|uniref:FecR family protein n=1 Tax=Polaribacter sp. TaxID=1920175 RepID=UPI00260C95DA|nr:FecR family protein [Polaribacter sp.]MDG1402542.1 FecR family protein [Polaribacter sp.]
MEKEYLIKKWLDNELTSEEEIAFNASENFLFLKGLTKDLKEAKFKSNFNEEQEYSKIKDKLELKKVTKNKIISLSLITKIAAIFVIGFSSLFYITSKKEVSTLIGETTVLNLPDNSKVTINASSSVQIKRFNWNRNIILKGEAYFEVEKGKKFVVATKDASVKVLGTKFNVIARDNYFETICYEGRVLVSYKNSKKVLHAGDKFLVIDSKIIETSNTKKNLSKWNGNKSSFKNIAIKHVLKEFERHYNVKIKANFNVDEKFTGSFIHDNENVALKSITLPFNLKIEKINNSITLSKND